MDGKSKQMCIKIKVISLTYEYKKVMLNVDIFER